MTASWLTDAVIYEIYPQSYADSNGDGIGDLRGVIDRLDYIASLGIDAIWFNPCFESPFFDAGYDVSDYLRIAPRYGTNDDLVELVDKARKRGIRVLLDLVVGHTSIEHPWFQAELAADGASPQGDRYVWRTDPPETGWDTDLPGTPNWVRSPGPRPGWYLKNFYDEQPALNFGWVDPQSHPWRDAVDAPGPLRNREALRDILDFWLGKGVAGFRVDMAFSLVKDDDREAGQHASTEIWRELRRWLDEAYPEAVLIPEGHEPRTGGPFGFHADFALVIFGVHASLFNDHSAGLLPWQEPLPPFFDAAGQGSTQAFLDAWRFWREDDPTRVVIMATADHDFNRLRCGGRTPEQLGAALTFLFTWGTVPSLYYGDEIGMRYLPDMPNVEGAVCHPAYNRAGCRTPMQWDDTANAGFSSAAPDALYLPVDPDPARPTVATQDGVAGSTLELVRELLALRRRTPALQGHAATTVLHAGYPLAWSRGPDHLVVVNPRQEPALFASDDSMGMTQLFGAGCRLVETGVEVDGFGYGIFEKH